MRDVKNLDNLSFMRAVIAFLIAMEIVPEEVKMLNVSIVARYCGCIQGNGNL